MKSCCRNLQRLLCDYVDGTLAPDERRLVDQSAAACPSCAEQLADAEYAVAVIRQAPNPEPPPELIADIVHGTIGAEGTLAAVGGGETAPKGGVLGFLDPILQPLLQPRFAMSMAMTVLSLSMLTFLGHDTLRSWDPSQSNTAAAVESLVAQFDEVWDEAVQAWETLQGFYALEADLLETAPSSQDTSNPPAAEAGAQTVPAEDTTAPGGSGGAGEEGTP